MITPRPPGEVAGLQNLQAVAPDATDAAYHQLSQGWNALSGARRVATETLMQSGQAMSRGSRSSPPSIVRAGFSLAELVVCVGILTVLAGLTFPTVSRVREAARRVTDLSNLRQLTAACLCYAQSNDGTLPPGRMASAPPGADDYTWTNYSTLWRPLLAASPDLAKLTSCISVREGFADADEFGQPQDDYASPNDIRLGWIYWAGRDDLAAAGALSYRSMHHAFDRFTPGSQTLWTCMCWDSNGSYASSVCPHVGSRYVEYPSGVTLKPPPDGLGVALTDGSASFVTWTEMVIIPQANGFKLYYQP
jgi:type II secretory pathway pseudopilin PulG